MKLLLVRPARAGRQSGNDITLRRWARILTGLGREVAMDTAYTGQPCDALVALHALDSHPSIRRFRNERPGAAAVVVLGGTDLYRDLPRRPEARESLELATFIVVLQRMALRELDPKLHPKVRVIYQSASPVPPEPREDDAFRVCVVGHLRPLKDPLRPARAARLLPEDSRIEVVSVGRALSGEMEREARAEAERNPRFRWLGERPHEEVRRFLAA